MSGSGEGGSSSVVSLVQQLKAGKMSKEELFDHLSRIQKDRKSAKEEHKRPQSAHGERPDQVAREAVTSSYVQKDRRDSTHSSPSPDRRNMYQHDESPSPQVQQHTFAHKQKAPRELLPEPKVSKDRLEPKGQGMESSSAPAPETDEDAILAKARDAYKRRQAEQEQRSKALQQHDHPTIPADYSDGSEGGSPPLDRQTRAPQRSFAGGRSSLGSGAQRVEGGSQGGSRQGGERRTGASPGPSKRPASPSPGVSRQPSGGIMGPKPKPDRPQSGRPLWGSTNGATSGGVERRRGFDSPAAVRKQGSGPITYKEFQFATEKRGMTDKKEERMRAIAHDRECTFKPKLYKSSSADYVRQDKKGSPSDIYDRQLAWLQRREEEVERKRAESEKDAVKECTFTPTVFTQHHRPSTAPAGGGENVPPDDTASQRSRRPDNVTERLYTHSVEHRKHVQEFLESQKQAEFEKHCTFAPAVNPSGKRDPTPVKSRYREATPSKAQVLTLRQRLEEEELKQCTFTPRVNTPSKSMQVARQYLSEPAWERLSKPRLITSQDSMENTYHNSIITSGRGTSPRPGRGVSPGPGDGRGGGTPQSGKQSFVRRLNETQESTATNFDSFLARQEDFLRKQDMNIQLRRSEIEGNFRPTMSAVSERIIQRKIREEGGTLARPFLERVEHTLEIKNANLAELASRLHSDQTFRPKINKSAQEMPARTPAEMSEGDYKRHQEMREALRHDQDSKDSEVYTFKPKLNISPGVQSRLKISSDPNNYLVRLEHEAKMQQRQQLIHAQEMLEQEMKECTFRPTVHEVPGYIQSMSAAQKKKNQDSSSVRQEDSVVDARVKGWNSSVTVDDGTPKIKKPFVK